MIEEHKLHDKIDFKASFCMKECQNPNVAVTLNGTRYNVAAETAREFFTENILPFAK
jgi:(2Fe-2S) ferredoxin